MVKVFHCFTVLEAILAVGCYVFDCRSCSRNIHEKQGKLQSILESPCIVTKLACASSFTTYLGMALIFI